MRRLVLTVTVLVFVPAVALSATTLEELLERGRGAAYTGEQMISCETPDGVRGVFAKISQSAGEISIAPSIDPGSEVVVGAGSWSQTHDGGVISSAVVAGPVMTFESNYVVEESGPQWFMGRDASGYLLTRDGVLRGEVVIDEETGAMVRVTSYNADGTPYCLRRFVTFDPADPQLPDWAPSEGGEMTPVEGDVSKLPADVGGFFLLDSYTDGGLSLTYYSDGLFSFAVFDAPVRVDLPDSVEIEIDGARYKRLFTAGQVTYAWEVQGRGMALVGDLPPDLHQPVLEAMPQPSDLGLFQRLWRNLFGDR